MTESKFKLKNWFSFIPDKGPGIVTLILLLVVTFSLGAILIGGRDKEPVNATTADDHLSHTEKSPTIWTCSMHPQIQLPEPGKCPLCFMDLIPLETGVDNELGPRQLEMSASAVKLASIQTSAVIRGSVASEIRLTGRITYDETALARITSWIPGRLEKLYVDFTGQTVKKGEPLLEIYSPQLQSAQEEFMQAVSTLSKMNDKRSSLHSTAEAITKAAREKLRLYGLTNDQIRTLEEKGETTERITVHAPIGGVVVGMEARAGIYVETGSTLYSIAGLSKVWVNFDVYESDLPWLATGQEIKFNSRAFPGKIFRGKIDFIDPVLNEMTRTVTVRVSVDNSDYLLKPDMFVSGTVQGSTTSANNNSLLIPATAPLLTGTRAVVYIRLPGHDRIVFEGREVQLGAKAGQYYIVAEGLNEGELVVTNGAFRIDSELQLQAKPSMMNPSGDKQALPHVHDHGDTQTMQANNKRMPEQNTESALNINTAALNGLSALYEAYFEIQMALALDDQGAATDAYQNYFEKIGDVDMALFEGSVHKRWMDISRTLSTYAGDGKKASDIVKSRDAFFHLSNIMIEMENEFGHVEDRDYYLTFCPMARNHTGAFWLQAVDTVYNSFYGASMLRCGEIREILGTAAITGE